MSQGDASVAGAGGPPYHGDMEPRVTALETRLDTILPTLATKADIADMRADTQKNLAEMRGEMQESHAEMRVEMQQAHAEMRAEMHVEMRKMNDTLHNMAVEMHKMNAEIKTWTLATMLTIVGTMLAAILGISQIFKASTVAPVAAPSPAPIVIYAQPSAAPTGKP
jgi:Mg2+ and Co2+ transporter CorA